MAAASIAAMACSCAGVSRAKTGAAISQPTVCAGFTRELDQVWNDAIARATSQRFSEIGAGKLDALGRQVVEGLSQLGGRWQREREALCIRAQNGDGFGLRTYRMRAACYDDVFNFYERVVYLVARADLRAAQGSFEALIELESDVASCSREAGFSAYELDLDARSAEHAARARKHAAAARAALLLGPKTLAAEEAAAAKHEARAASLDNPVARVTLVEAALSEAAQRPDEARLKYEIAHDLFQNGGCQMCKVAAIAGISRLLSESGKRDAALLYLDRAIGLTRSALGPETVWEAELLVRLGSARHALGDRSSAQADYDRAQEALAASDSGRPIGAAFLRSEISGNRAIALAAAGKRREATAAYEKACALLEPLGLHYHSAAARWRRGIADAALVAGDLVSATKAYGEALQVALVLPGPKSVEAAACYEGLAAAANGQNRPEEAAAHLELAITARVAAGGTSSLELAEKSALVGRLRIGLGQEERALLAYEQAGEFRRAAHGADSIEVARADRLVAHALHLASRLDSAAARYLEACARLRTADALEGARCDADLGDTVLAQGRAEEARRLYESALASLTAAPAEERAQLEMRVGMALDKLNKPQLAVSRYRRATALLDRSSPSQRLWAAYATADAGAAECRRGNKTKAKEDFSAALSLLREEHGDAAAAALVEGWSAALSSKRACPLSGSALPALETWKRNSLAAN